MITSILQLLRAMANDNKEVQNQLFAHLQTLLAVKHAPSTLAELLKEVQLRLVVVFLGNTDTTCKISFSRYLARILNVAGE